ncbi:hypothetical protein VOLCADRAFT_89124 [Volvox carteri f. nagariensis]|uniref:Photolyase/cryptochrome alpha/beta domain-containing protein n=1 Tax=Volvox carteri f. nagariensis TaxID=3068 RepID=D8TQV2_VOLCA|nr:uncharacterized protein VOLCADRAFT_89124 [Volvox carteri f. nagariensis]EFJ50097.1 hypothetical protein VOLCADRAFT_89124 [Volvox carteri f. nagariensis]|eukprot:XP_002948717.1 hypothetical protein VOLCADRAFT_89124 [Volvox carteri f. nagariensis]
MVAGLVPRMVRESTRSADGPGAHLGSRLLLLLLLLQLLVPQQLLHTAAPLADNYRDTTWYDVSELPQHLGPTEPVVLWYRNDLRVDDHPGLTAAAVAVGAAGPSGTSASPRPLAPVFLLDPVRLSYLAFTPGGPEALSAALERLRAELRVRGSDLAIRVGSWEQQLTAVARTVGSRAVVSEAEVELRWRLPAGAALDRARDALGVASYGWRAALWRADHFDIRYRTWRAQRGPPAEPLPAPSALPPFPASVEPGRIPGAAEMRKLLTEAALAVYDDGKDSGLAAVAAAVAAECASGPDADRAVRVCAGPDSPLQLLKMYLGTAPAPPPSATATASSVSLDEEVAALRRPGVDGAPFTGLFSSAKALGTLSARRVLKEAYIADGRPYGSVDPQRLRTPAAVAAAVAAEAADFHRALAVLDDDRVVGPGVEVHFWRWRGGLTDYCVAEPEQPLPGAPAVLLVHGFGAFGDQWRDNMAALAAAGFRVLAPTFPGFGRSQKAAVPYSQDLWRDFLRDFVLQVVGAPVVVAGNSIGGFISTCLAADYPPLVRGLVLLNSAGPIDPSFNIDSWRAAVAAGRPAPPALLVSAISSALFWYLERTVPSTLKWLYPTNPAKADEWLEREILRAAGDSGAIDVFKAVWYLPPPRALNWLIAEAWRGPTLVLQSQGALDPLNDAPSRARQLGRLCTNVEVELLQAGHCPHDEVPEQVNEALLRFIRTSVLRDEQGGSTAATTTPAVAAASPAPSLPALGDRA